jgi:hypothetical protein
LTVSFELSERFMAAAAEWGEIRLMDRQEALEAKVEQALLEIEHLISGATAVEFTVEDDVVYHEPTEELTAFLDAQASETGTEETVLLRSYVDLFARTFLDEDSSRPPNAPPQ